MKSKLRGAGPSCRPLAALTLMLAASGCAAGDGGPSPGPDGAGVESTAVGSGGHGVGLAGPGGGEPFPEADPTTEDVVAFHAATEDSNFAIFVTTVDDPEPRQLTTHPAVDLEPALSPDGERIAFTSWRDGNAEIYLIGTDGSGLTRLTDHYTEERSATFSPDGTLIAFVSDRDGNPEIYRMASDGSAPTRLTDSYNYDAEPVFSADGQRIFFVSGRDSEGYGEIYVMNLDGSDQERLTHNTTLELAPTVSPDGAFIVYTGVEMGYPHESHVVRMNVDGSAVTQLTQSDGHSKLRATVTPDSSRIVFAAGGTANWHWYWGSYWGWGGGWGLGHGWGWWYGQGTSCCAGADATYCCVEPAVTTACCQQDVSCDEFMDQAMCLKIPHTQLHVMNADGTSLSQLTSLSPGLCDHPSAALGKPANTLK